MSEETDDEIADKVLRESLGRVRDSNPAPSAQREEKTIEELEEKLAVAVRALKAIAEPYTEEWNHMECITALRRDEHEARTALHAIRERKGENG
jgi:hypothetical protein